MNPEEILELAALKAVGAMSPKADGQLQELLSSAEPATRAEAMRLQDEAALLAVAQTSARQPSAALKGKILARVQAGELSKSALNPFFTIGRNEGQWQTLPIPGVRVKDLSVDVKRGTSVKLYELAAGAHFPEHHHSGPEECYVVAGDFHVEGRVLHTGDFHHAEGESDHGESFSENGCTLLVMVSSHDYK